MTITVNALAPGTTGGVGGSFIDMFQPNRGVSLAHAFRDFKDEFSITPATAAKGTRELNRDVSFYGLAAVVPGNPETVTDNLRAGTYYLRDPAKAVWGGPLPVPVTLTVQAGGTSQSPHDSVPVAATSADRFIVSIRKSCGYRLVGLRLPAQTRTRPQDFRILTVHRTGHVAASGHVPIP